VKRVKVAFNIERCVKLNSMFVWMYRREVIDHCFEKDTVEEIFEALVS
jgi:hypothetical protein